MLKKLGNLNSNLYKNIIYNQHLINNCLILLNNMSSINLKYRRFQYKLKNHFNKLLIINKNKINLSHRHQKIIPIILLKD